MKPTKPTVDGPITRALMEAVDMRRQMLDSGMSEAEVDQRIGQGLKAVLGNPRPQVWKFLCERCHDTGWSSVRPTPDEEAKLLNMYGTTENSHGYYVKCDPCPYMNREREKRRRQLGQDSDGFGEEDFAAAGQVKPKRGFSRFGK